MGTESVMVGAIAALSAAACWAIATVLYERLGRSLPPLVLNGAKGCVAIAVIAGAMALLGQPWSVDGRAIALLGLSGFLGIAVGDTAYFLALNRLGARRVLLFELLVPILVTIAGSMLLGERLPLPVWAGIGITVGGVGWTLAEQSPEPSGRSARSPSLDTWGMGWAVIAAIAQVAGALLARTALAETVVLPLHSALVRLVAGTVPVLLWLAIARLSRHPHRRTYRKPLTFRTRWRTWGAIALAALTGTFGGIWLQQTAFKYAPVGVAQTLIATSPIFVLPVVAILGDRLSWRASVGACVATAGVAIVAFSLV
ncbi:MAG: DMT family transporter [Cyanophyceae cyanobacterium]